MPTFYKKFIFSFLSALTLLFSFAPYLTIKAADNPGTWYNSSFFDWYKKAYDTKNPSEIFGERYTAAQVQWIAYSLPSMVLNSFLGIVPGSENCIFAFSSAGETYIPACGIAVSKFIVTASSTLGLTALLTESESPNKNLATEVFNPENRSVSGIKYTKNLIGRLSPVSTVHAQGFGYQALDSVQKYWSGFRNIAYAMVVLVTIIFAFMIMFKVKLNPQTVITVQSALPKIIAAVVLATFSYAIAGFMIDLMYVVGGLMASMLKIAGFGITSRTTTLGIYHWIIPSAGNVLGNFTIFWFMLAYVLYFAIALIAAFLSIVVSNVVIFGLFGIIVSLVFVFLWVWIFVLMIWYTIKVPWVLIKNLISLYTTIVVGPLQIVAGAVVPSLGFSQWLKKLAAELLAFPLTGMFMYLAWVTLGSSFAADGHLFQWDLSPFSTATNNSLWTPEIIGGTASMAPLLWLAISFSFIVMIPQAINIMKMAIMGERWAYGTAFNEAAGPARAVWGSTGGVVIGGIQRGTQEAITQQYAPQFRAIVGGIRSRLPQPLRGTNTSSNIPTQGPFTAP